MQTTIELADAQSRLAELVGGLTPPDEIVLVVGEQPVARIVPLGTNPPGGRVPERHPGAMTMSPDFDEPLPDEFWGFDR